MAAITDISDIISIATGANKESLWFFKNNRVNGVAASSHVAAKLVSYFLYDGSPSNNGSIPTSAAAPDNTFAGGMEQSDPGGGREKWLLSASLCASAAGTGFFYDRLLHISGLSGTAITAQTVGGTLTRYTSGAGNEIYVEIYAIVGGTARTITAIYTNQAGDSKTTQAVAFGGTGDREAQRFIKLPLQEGDTGVRAVASVTISATTGTAGNFGVVIGHPLAMVPIGLAGVGETTSLLTSQTGPELINTDACIAIYWHSTGTAVVEMTSGNLFMVEK